MSVILEVCSIQRVQPIGLALSPVVFFDLKVGGARKTSSLDRRLYRDLFLT